MKTPFLMMLLICFSLTWADLSFAKEAQNSAGSGRQPSSVGEANPQAQPAAPANNQKKSDTGDIDMYQFQNLNDAPPSNRASTKNLPVQMTCTSPNGVVIKKGETGFDTCVTNSQSRLLKQQHTPEAPDDPRTF